MDDVTADRELTAAPSSLKSKLWKHFGFEVVYDSERVRSVVKDRVTCRHCFAEMKYTSSTTNMSFHLARHDPEMKSDLDSHIPSISSNVSSSSSSSSSSKSNQMKLTDMMTKKF